MFFTKSFRWVLTYNLALDPSDVRPSAGLQKSDTRDPRHTLRRWLHQEKKSRLVDHVYYKLDHEYTQANISHNALKNRDFACVQTLQDISSEFPVDIFPGHTGEKKGRHLDEDYDYYGLDEDEEDGYDGIYPFDRLGSSGTSYLTTSLVDLDGLQVMQHTGLDETKVLQEDGFDEADPAEEYQGYTGNEGGPQETHWYRIAAMVIVPRDSTASFLMASWEGDEFSLSYGQTQENLSAIIGYFA